MAAPRIQYKCGSCDKIHEGLPAIAFAEPFHYWSVPEGEREARVKASPDLCVVDGGGFFIRAVLQIPIAGEDESLEWGVWGTLNEENFNRYVETFLDEDQGKLGAMFSWFASRLPGYPDTLSIRSTLLPRDFRRRPLVDFEPDQDHPLVRDKRDGITLERAVEFVRPVLHPH